MKSLIALSIMWTTLAFAQFELPANKSLDEYKSITRPAAPVPVYNVPIKHPNTDQLLGVKGFQKFYKRDIKCDGETYALIYIQQLGIFPGTSYLTLCDERTGKDCTQDTSEKIQRCRERAARHYNAGATEKTQPIAKPAETIDQVPTTTSQ